MKTKRVGREQNAESARGTATRSLPVNRKEERLLTPALSSTEEEREKKALGRFGGIMRECFRGNLSSTEGEESTRLVRGFNARNFFLGEVSHLNRKEERLLSPCLRQKRYGRQAALSSTEEATAKRARGWFGG